MPTNIPYDPNLDLGNIVPPSHLKVLENISALQTPIDAAQDELNSLIMLRRKLDMTKDELTIMDVDVTDLEKPIDDVNSAIKTAAATYATTSATNLPKVAEERKAIPQISSAIESPIDYNKSEIKQMPLAADTMTMDAQYFSFDEETQKSSDQMAALKAFVSASTSFLGDKASVQATTTTGSQVAHQIDVHDIQGTLVITCSCTHRQADLFAPFVIDVDKGIRAWNELIAIGELTGDMIKVNDAGSISKIAEQQQTKGAAFYNLLSGITTGSSFVGMVHVLKDSSTQTDQHMRSTAASLQGQMEVGSWFADYKGGFGVDGSFSSSAKSLLSSQNITSHISLVTMGIIPTIEANDVQLAVKQFTDFSPDKMMGQLAVLQNATADAQSSISSAADNARTGGQMVALEASKIKSAVSAVGELDDGKNKMLDINSLMTAFTDFVTKAAAGGGVPINYFLKPITASQLAQMWVSKYLPGEYVTSAGDDTNPNEPKTDGS
jgi:hypothetical protein